MKIAEKKFRTYRKRLLSHRQQFLHRLQSFVDKLWLLSTIKILQYGSRLARPMAKSIVLFSKMFAENRRNVQIIWHLFRIPRAKWFTCTAPRNSRKANAMMTNWVTKLTVTNKSFSFNLIDIWWYNDHW